MSRRLLFVLSLLVSIAVAQEKIPALHENELTSEYPKQHSPEAEFYRRVLLNVSRKGEFLFRAPGAEPVKIQYQFEWDWSNSLMKKQPELQKTRTARWIDRGAVGPNSYIIVGNNPKKEIPMSCVYVRGFDNLSEPLKPEFTRFNVEVFLVSGDKGCQGPTVTDSRIFAPRSSRWSNYLSFELRDLRRMTPEYPKLQFFDNPFQLTYSGVDQ